MPSYTNDLLKRSLWGTLCWKSLIRCYGDEEDTVILLIDKLNLDVIQNRYKSFLILVLDNEWK